jgi:hypothetical protein
MRLVKAHLKSISPYSQSRFHNTPKGGRQGTGTETESNEDYRARTWREHCHVNADGYIQIPPMAFKNALSEIAKYLGVKIPGKGKSTYTKHIESGVMVVDPLVLGIKKEDVEGEDLFLPSDGVRGSGKRVMKRYPIIREWSGVATFHILDDVLTPEVFEQHLREAGNFIGIGRFRPRNNGYYGRFAVEKLEWAKL